MRVLLDGRAVAFRGETIADAIEACRPTVEEAGRVIIEVLLDGEPLRDEALTSRIDSPAGDAELRLVTADPVALVSQSLFDAADALEATRDTHLSLAEQIQTGEAAESLGELSETLRVWQVAQDVLTQGYALLGKSTESIRAVPGPEGADEDVCGHGPAEEMIERLAGQLREIKRALGDQDFTAVADALAYELAPLSTSWSAMLRTAAKETAANA